MRDCGKYLGILKPISQPLADQLTVQKKDNAIN
jgi:hypothetical protein